MFKHLLMILAMIAPSLSAQAMPDRRWAEEKTIVRAVLPKIYQLLARGMGEVCYSGEIALPLEMGPYSVLFSWSMPDGREPGAAMLYDLQHIYPAALPISAGAIMGDDVKVLLGNRAKVDDGRNCRTVVHFERPRVAGEWVFVRASRQVRGSLGDASCTYAFHREGVAWRLAALAIGVVS